MEKATSRRSSKLLTNGLSKPRLVSDLKNEGYPSKGQTHNGGVHLLFEYTQFFRELTEYRPITREPDPDSEWRRSDETLDVLPREYNGLVQNSYIPLPLPLKDIGVRLTSSRGSLNGVFTINSKILPGVFTRIHSKLNALCGFRSYEWIETNLNQGGPSYLLEASNYDARCPLASLTTSREKKELEYEINLGSNNGCKFNPLKGIAEFRKAIEPAVFIAQEVINASIEEARYRHIRTLINLKGDLIIPISVN